MTTPFHPRSGPAHLYDLIDKHVPPTNPLLAEFYANADKTRQHLKDIGAWPGSVKSPRRAPEGKRGAPVLTPIAAEAYEWGIANGATTIQAAAKFAILPDVIHSYVQYRDLPRLKRTNKSHQCPTHPTNHTSP